MKHETIMAGLIWLAGILAIVALFGMIFPASPQQPQPAELAREIIIVSIDLERTFYDSEIWVMTYLLNDSVQTLYAPSAEHINRILQRWELSGAVAWIGAAE
jgi:hypothetical protein